MPAPALEGWRLALVERLDPSIGLLGSPHQARDIGEHGFAGLSTERACEMAEHCALSPSVPASRGWTQAHRHRLQIERRERRLIEPLALMDADGVEDGVDTNQAEAAEMLLAPAPVLTMSSSSSLVFPQTRQRWASVVVSFSSCWFWMQRLIGELNPWQRASGRGDAFQIAQMKFASAMRG